MTREELHNQKERLELRRKKLVDQLTDVDVSSASLSSGGGSKSYTNRSIADIKAKIAFIDKEIARIDSALNGTPGPGSIQTTYVRFDS